MFIMSVFLTFKMISILCFQKNLEKLNHIVWPSIAGLAKSKIQEAADKGNFICYKNWKKRQIFVFHIQFIGNPSGWIQ